MTGGPVTPRRAVLFPALASRVFNMVVFSTSSRGVAPSIIVRDALPSIKGSSEYASELWIIVKSSSDRKSDWDSTTALSTAFINSLTLPGQAYRIR